MAFPTDFEVQNMHGNKEPLYFYFMFLFHFWMQVGNLYLYHTEVNVILC